MRKQKAILCALAIVLGNYTFPFIVFGTVGEVSLPKDQPVPRVVAGANIEENLSSPTGVYIVSVAEAKGTVPGDGNTQVVMLQVASAPNIKAPTKESRFIVEHALFAGDAPCSSVVKTLLLPGTSYVPVRVTNQNCDNMVARVTVKNEKGETLQQMADLAVFGQAKSASNALVDVTHYGVATAMLALVLGTMLFLWQRERKKGGEFAAVDGEDNAERT